MKKFEHIVSEFLQLPEAEVADALTPHEIPNWDSMNYLLLIAALEKEYGISLTMDEVLSAKSLGDVRAALRSKGVPV